MELQIEWMDSQLSKCFTQASKLGEVATIVNIFDSVINIELTNPSVLITLSKKEGTPAPYMMKVASNPAFNRLRGSVTVGDTFQFETKGEISVKQTKLVYRSAKEFSSHLLPVSKNYSEMCKKKTEIDGFLKTSGSYGGLLNAYLSQEVKDHHLTVSLSMYDNYFRQLLKKLSEDFTADNLKRFVGLGVGLTPSGDDFIVGLLSVLTRYDVSGKHLSEIRCEFKKNTIEKKTTRVSAHMINYALEGCFNAALIELVCGKEAEALNKVKSIGSTSGTDMLTGVAFGLNRLITFQKERAS